MVGFVTGELSLWIMYPTSSSVMEYYLNINPHAAFTYHASRSMVINRLIVSFDSCFLELCTTSIVDCVQAMLISVLSELLLLLHVCLVNPAHGGIWNVAIRSSMCHQSLS